MAAKTSWFSTVCYVGEHPKVQSPEAFRMQFCTVCRNVECSESAVSKSRWQARMDTQVDRLLENPLFGDPNDPKFRDITSMDFEDRLREAMALEISSQRNDWEPVSEAEISAALGQVTSKAPAGFQPPKAADEAPEALPTAPNPPAGPPKGPVLLWDGQAKGTGGTLYRITLVQLESGEQAWSCTCPAAQYRGGQCKHIQEAVAMRDQTEVQEPPVANNPTPTKPPNNSPATPQKWEQARQKGNFPKAKNTTFPTNGMMIDGSAPPASNPPADPWAPAAPVVPVGGKVVLGGPPKKD
jgi:hypothetical protein